MIQSSTSHRRVVEIGGTNRRPRMFKVPVRLMRALGGMLGFGAEIDRLTQSLELDISKTRELLGWEPPVSGAAGIADMARAFAGRSS
jgi:nucleoside-diphosphate-sugar epimerase